MVKRHKTEHKATEQPTNKPAFVDSANEAILEIAKNTLDKIPTDVFSIISDFFPPAVVALPSLALLCKLTTKDEPLVHPQRRILYHHGLTFSRLLPLSVLSNSVIGTVGLHCKPTNKLVSTYRVKDDELKGAIVGLPYLVDHSQQSHDHLKSTKREDIDMIVWISHSLDTVI